MALIFVGTVLVGSLLVWLSECIVAIIGDVKGVALATILASTTKEE